MFDGVPVYVSLKVIRLEEEDNKHIVIGISNVDAQMKRQQEAERARAESLTFAGIAQALAADYFSIYYVDMETDRSLSTLLSEEYQGLNIEKGAATSSTSAGRIFSGSSIRRTSTSCCPPLPR
jgi:hypothetical protein